MRRIAGAVLAVAVALGALGATEALARPTGMAAPSAVPEGYVLLGARAPDALAASDRPYYAHSASSGPALSGGTLYCEDGCDALAGSERRVSSLDSGRIVRNGRWVWVTWISAENNDTGYVVVGRDLPDRAVIAAARAARASDGQLRRIDASGLPSGFRKLGAFDVMQWGIPFGAERVTIGPTDGPCVVDAYTYQYASAAARAAQRFWSEQAPLMAGSAPTSRVPRCIYHAVLVESGDRAVVLVGSTDDEMLRAFGQSFRDVDDAQWQAFASQAEGSPH